MHGYDIYWCGKVLIVTTNYNGYDNYKCDKVLIVTPKAYINPT